MTKNKEEKNANNKVSGFYKLKQLFFSNIKNIIWRDNISINNNLINQIEYCLLSYDIGYDMTNRVINHIKHTFKDENVINIKSCYNITKSYLYNMLCDFYSSYKYIHNNNIYFNNIKQASKPYIFMLVGVNGVGKTTTISKIGHMLQNQGFSSVFAAADTFRAAAIEQLTYWADELRIPIVKTSTGSDPGSIVFKTLDYAKLNNIDVVLIDTSGRLHNNVNLMNELGKILRIIKRKTLKYPEEISLVMDATIGYNSLNQMNEFKSILGINSIIVSKLDSSAKGGIFINLIDKFKVPINFVSYGESLQKFNFFNINKYVNSFF
jgi:fused signal recognition particle receptor